MNPFPCVAKATKYTKETPAKTKQACENPMKSSKTPPMMGPWNSAREIPTLNIAEAILLIHLDKLIKSQEAQAEEITHQTQEKQALSILASNDQLRYTSGNVAKRLH